MEKLSLYIMILFSLLFFSSCIHFSETPYGTFYSLKTLYENKEIDKNDLLNIAYWNNNGNVINENGEAINVNINQIVLFDELNKDIAAMIANDFYLMIKDEDCFKEDSLKLNELLIHSYCGVYNDYFAFRIKNEAYFNNTMEDESVGGFKYFCTLNNSSNILLWKLNEK